MIDYEDHGLTDDKRELPSRLVILERENRELRGELMTLKNGINGIIDKCHAVLQTG